MIYVNHDTLGKLAFEDGTSKEVMTNAIVELEAEQGEQYGVLGTFADQAGRSFSSSYRGIKDFIGVEKTAEEEEEDQQAEYISRVQMEQNPISSVLGMFAGGIADPITLPAFALKPLTFASKVGTFAARGAAQGFAGGAVEPVYEQYGDSTVANIFAGTVLGTGLGAGIGKILTKSGSKVDDEVLEGADSEAGNGTSTVITKDASQKEIKEPIQGSYSKSVEDILVPVRTVDQANAKILEELELEAKGAPSQRQLDDLNALLKTAKKESTQLGTILGKLTAGRAKAGLGKRKKIPAKSAQAKVIEARAVETNNRIKQLELEIAEGTTKRKAVINYEKAKLGKFSKVEGYDQRLAKATAPLQRTPMAQAVRTQHAAPTAAPTFADARPVLARKLGLTPEGGRRFNQNDSAGAQRVNQDPLVAEQFMPRSTVKSTQGVVDGKFNGENKEPIVPIKISDQARADIKDAEAKLAKGKGLTPKERERYERALKEEELLLEYEDSSAQIAASRGLDTYANRFEGFGRYTFENIQRRSNKFLKDENIENLDDMVRYILSNPNKLFNAAELNGMRDLLVEVDQKLLDLTILTRNTENMTDAEVALLHNDIDVFYGIQSWFKGQGSKAAGVFTARKKLYKDIANNRAIKQLYAGVEC
jgi:hypothetical protein